MNKEAMIQISNKLSESGQQETKMKNKSLVLEDANRQLFVEVSEGGFDFYGYGLSAIIARYKSPFQDILIADTKNYGRILVLDGAIQSAQDDEALYHELLVHPAMLGHEEPKDVLILGGGEGATLREVLKYKSVETVCMVDIDRQAVELCRRYLPTWHQGAFNDNRVKLVFADGRKYIEENQQRYDVVIIDVVDMLDNGPAQGLYTRQFYDLLHLRLHDQAIVVVQGLEFSHLDWAEHRALLHTLQTVFHETHSYKAHIPSFLSSWGFLIASDWFSPTRLSSSAYDERIARRLPGVSLEHVTGAFISSRFQLCKKTQTLLKQPGSILEDGIVFAAG